MASRFTQAQIATVRELLELPDDQEKFRPEKNSLAIEEVCRALHLPPIPYSQYIGPHCWLAGGRVLRWLCSVGRDEYPTKGDFDFYFPSSQALNSTARAMLDQGFRLVGYTALSKNLGEYLRKRPRQDRQSGVWDVSGNLATITPEQIERLKMTSLELRSPEDDRIQLITLLHPSPLETILRFDFSICQLIVDHQSLTFGPWTWHDILHSQFRKVYLWQGDYSFGRLFKYAYRGFRPYPDTVLVICCSALACLATKLPRLCITSLIDSLQRNRGKAII